MVRMFGTPNHNLEPIVQEFDSQEAAMQQIVRNVNGPLPESSPFEIAQDIGGQTEMTRGAVVDSIVRIGTAFSLQ